MENFTPIASTLGGVLIGLAAALLFLVNGRIAGISGILSGVLKPRSPEFDWKLAFVAGLVAGGGVMFFFMPEMFVDTLERSSGALIVAGLLVGFGTRLGNGCTSGHGVCGLARFSPRSLAITGAFMATGAASVYVVNHLLGGAL
jgi:uncharacterized membrane protein YedE/YeeE